MALKARYTVVNGETIAEKRDGMRRQLVPDPLGSTAALLDSTQAQTDTFSYWPYGEGRTRTGTTPTPFRYIGGMGYYRDSASRAYVRARTLLVTYGRWMTVDPLERAAVAPSPYAYCDDNPVLVPDPSGMLSTADDVKKIVKCLAKCKGDEIAVGICIGDCLGLAFVRRHCSQVVCLWQKALCMHGNPCDSAEQFLQKCNDCCYVKFYCCLMQLRNFAGATACHANVDTCELKCDEKFGCGPASPLVT